MQRNKKVQAMKRSLLQIFIVLAVALSACSEMYAQSLVGRIYTNPNIMADELNKAFDEAEKKVSEKRDEFFQKAREKKGRELTEKETQEVEAQLQKTEEMMKAVKDGMKTSITVEFTSETELVMKMKMEMKEEALKAAGVSWAKRKAMKMALAVAPSSQKGTYVVEGNQIFVTEHGENEKDTLRLSNDGKKLYGKLDEKKKFVLTRTK